MLLTIVFYQSIAESLGLSIFLSLCFLWLYLSVSMSLCLLCLSVSLSLCRSISQFLYLSVSISLSPCLSVSYLFCLFLCFLPGGDSIVDPAREQSPILSSRLGRIKETVYHKSFQLENMQMSGSVREHLAFC